MPLGCGADGPDDAEHVSDVGSIRLALIGYGSSGAVYRLSNAWFDIQGPTDRSVQADGEATVLTELLPVGSYLVTLEPGWVLGRWTGVDYQPVPAGLKSPNPLSVAIHNGSTSTIAFEFRTQDDVVSVGEGTLDILVGVDDTTPLREATAVACSNGHDDDTDRLVDCDDPDCQAQPFCAPSGLVIEGFEDGDFIDFPPYARSLLPFIGPWVTQSDGTIPQVELVSTAGPASPTALGVFSPAVPSAWGAGAMLSFDRYPANMSGFQGIRFNVRSQASPVRFEAGTLLTVPGGYCSTCFDSHGMDLPVGSGWVAVELRWSDLTQQGWGTPAPFEPWSIVNLSWRTPAGQPVGLEIDDVELF
ncbi:hypothetical protein WME91_09720 [Sorangium sp. So ce269]